MLYQRNLICFLLTIRLLASLILLGGCSQKSGLSGLPDYYQGAYTYSPANDVARQPAMPVRISADSPYIMANQPVYAQPNPVSTFGVDVDTSGYALVRSYLRQGTLPPRSSVRVEEMINYFPYDYPRPESVEEPVATAVSVLDCPWNKRSKILQVAVSAYRFPSGQRPPMNLVLLLDTSGSMEGPDRLELLVKSLGLLVDELGSTDKVSIVTYAGSAGVLLPPTAGNRKDEIKKALRSLKSGGATAGAAGLETAYNLAQDNFNPSGVNLVIIGTDGDFNVGYSQVTDLEKMIEEKRKTGIYLSVLLVGQGNLRDSIGQMLAQKGNGIAAYLDSLDEARHFLVDHLEANSVPVANDVKIQVVFNPGWVSKYRLIGYETRVLEKKEFKNDQADSGDMGSGHTVTAFYELTPVNQGEQRLTFSENNLAVINFSYKLPGQNESRQLSKTVKTTANEIKPSESSFALGIAAFSQILAGSEFLEGYSYEQAISLAQTGLVSDPGGYRGQALKLMKMAKGFK